MFATVSLGCAGALAAISDERHAHRSLVRDSDFEADLVRELEFCEVWSGAVCTNRSGWVYSALEDAGFLSTVGEGPNGGDMLVQSGPNLLGNDWEYAVFGSPSGAYVVAHSFHVGFAEQLTSFTDGVGTATGYLSIAGYGSCVFGFAPGCVVGSVAGGASTAAAVAGAVARCGSGRPDCGASAVTAGGAAITAGIAPGIRFLDEDFLFPRLIDLAHATVFGAIPHSDIYSVHVPGQPVDAGAVGEVVSGSYFTGDGDEVGSFAIVYVPNIGGR